MDLCNNEKTISMFKNKMTPSFQKALYAMITKAGLSDSHIKNIPFSNDGKIAFVDTKYVSTWPVHPEWCTPYFSKKNQHHWKKLMKGQD
jgi:hypothetical protein